jgi:uncharacterized membrane protein YpjA
LIKIYGRLRELVLFRPVAWAIMLIGLVGSVAGFVYWYGPTFARYPIWQWPFVPDCPLFAFLFVISLALILLRRRWPPYDAWVAWGLIKYGTWTVFVWVLYWIYTGGDFTTESVVMSLAHTGMVLEGLFLLSFLSMDWPTMAASALWFGLSDWMDYGPFLTYPHFPMASIPVGIAPSISYLDLVEWQTIGVTVLMSVVYAYMAFRRQRARGAIEP